MILFALLVVLMHFILKGCRTGGNTRRGARGTRRPSCGVSQLGWRHLSCPPPPPSCAQQTCPQVIVKLLIIFCANPSGIKIRLLVRNIAQQPVLLLLHLLLLLRKDGGEEEGGGGGEPSVCCSPSTPALLSRTGFLTSSSKQGGRLIVMQ